MRIHRSITLLAATLIGAVTTIMLLCAAALLIRFGGDDERAVSAGERRPDRAGNTGRIRDTDQCQRVAIRVAVTCHRAGRSGALKHLR